MFCKYLWEGTFIKTRSTEPTDPPTEPTDPPTKPTKPTEPTKPTKPTGPPTKPTDPLLQILFRFIVVYRSNSNSILNDQSTAIPWNTKVI